MVQSQEEYKARGTPGHVDERYKFVYEFVEDGFLKIRFVRSENNDVDIFTKNLKGELDEKHMRKTICEKGSGN